MRYFPLPCAILITFFHISAFAQTNAPLTAEDYQRAKDFQENMREKVYNLSVNPVWTPDSVGFAYLSNDQGGKQFLTIDFATLTKKPLFDHARLAGMLSDSLGKEIKAAELPFNRISFENARVITFSAGNKNFTYDLNTGELQQSLPAAPRNLFESMSPDGKWIAFAKDFNLFVRSTEGGEEIQLSHDGKKLFDYASHYGWGDIMEGEGGDRPRQFDLLWSPDSKKILTQICDLRHAEKMYLLDWSVDTLYRPRLLSYYRGSPGDTTVVYYHTVVFDLESRREIKTALPPAPHFNSINLDWNADSQKLWGYALSRGYKEFFFLEVQAESGKVDTIYRESSPTNIQFPEIHRLKEEEKLLFTSERIGWNQLYVLDLKSKKFQAITAGQFVVQNIIHVDEAKKRIYFTAGGREKGRNPYFDHLYRINYDGSSLQLLTPEDAHHEILVSPGGSFFIDNYSTAGQPTVSVLRSMEDGIVLTAVSKADPERLMAAGWIFPEVFETIGKDGKTPIYGAVWKPTHFDPAKKYPVIDNSYTGPHTNQFPGSFSSALNGANQALAEFGFVVVRIDGLGTNGRSRDFRDWSYGRLGEGLEDHIRAIRYLGEQYDWIDTSRVGIYGHSAGGYDAAHALLRFPDFYKVGVASSADHDHRMEKAWWPEMYMGWPVGDHYHDQSNITMAVNLKGKLLITHGGIDENVNPSATFKLAEAFIRAGKEFDMLILPSQRHGYRDVHGDYFILKRWNYFIEHLLGLSPLWIWEE